MTVCRAFAVSLGLSALFVGRAAAQAGATALATATVIDLSDARATMHAATTLAAQITGSASPTQAPARRDTDTASILISSPPAQSSDAALLTTITYW